MNTWLVAPKVGIRLRVFAWFDDQARGGSVGVGGGGPARAKANLVHAAKMRLRKGFTARVCLFAWSSEERGRQDSEANEGHRYVILIDVALRFEGELPEFVMG